MKQLLGIEQTFNITACLISWKRPQNIPKIVEKLLTYPFINEIIIQDNSKGENLKCYGRYISAKKAKNNFIYVQDDDWLVDVQPIYDTFIKDKEKIAHTGELAYEENILNNIYGSAQMALFGWGTIFDKRWISALDKYIDKYGQDNCFYRETDRIFSILLNRHHNFVRTELQSLNDRDEHAMSAQDDHIEYKQLAIDRALELHGKGENII